MDTYGNYAYVALFLLGGIGFVGGGFLVNRLITAPFKPGASKLIAYECGEPPIGEAWVQYNARYYLFAMLFVLFDVEAAFLIPWAVGFRSMSLTMGILPLVEMAIFLFILGMALVYAWRKGALEWV
ncbi:MAG: NADH-quinone oxidoreductase subunit A [Candidatus Eremiobacterota bacterium]